MIKIKELEENLQILSTFDKPYIQLEQYATSPHIAARMLHVAQMQFKDIENRAIADLGAGCGTLSIGATLLNALHVTGFDVDLSALKKCTENSEKHKTSVEVVCCDILHFLPGNFYNFFDTVIMNPPFGTKNNVGTDVKFLEIASKLTRNVIYSLHKSSTRAYILQKGVELGFNVEVLAELKYDLPQTYRFHKKKDIDVKVDFIRFSVVQ